MTTHDDRRSSRGTGSVSPPLCPARYLPQSVAACLFRAARRSSLAWAPIHARPFTAHRFGRRRSGRRKDARKPTGSPSRRGTSACSASGSGAAIARARRCDQRRVWLSRSQMPWLQHASDHCPRHRAATEGNAGPRIGTLHALQGLFCRPTISVQAEPSGGAARDQDHGERSAVNVVAGRAVS